MGRKPDFSGWATKFNIKCADGRTIKPGAFNEADGKKVPMVWQHDHNSVDNVLGHCVLECRKDGVYAYAYCNETERGQRAKELVHCGDIDQFSIYANELKQTKGDVVHGTIREVSLVLSGANTGAIIDNPILAHSGETVETEALIYTGEPSIMEDEPMYEDEIQHDAFCDPYDVIDTLDQAQADAVTELIGRAIVHTSESIMEDMDSLMRTNIFEREDNTMQHSAIDFDEVMSDAKRCGSLKEAYLAHAASDTRPHGQPGIDFGIGDGVTEDKHLVEGELLPHHHELYQTPGFWDGRHTEWCATLLSGATRHPFSRLKNMWFDITNSDYTDPTKLRARGYMKGYKKTEEVFGLMKRTTHPCTVYKKQRMDRDDLIDITDFDIVKVMKQEMRIKLDEELALCILLGDGRAANSVDKINEDCIRPIWKEPELFAPHYDITGMSEASSNSDIAAAFMDEVIRQRREYRGKGRPTLFIDPVIHTEMLLLRDLNGRRMYESDSALCTYMNVAKIVDVDDITGKIRTTGTSPNVVYHKLFGILVNPSDYRIGADKGGNVNMFDDFDIDFNQYVYLIETRISGSLLDPKVAQIFEVAGNWGNEYVEEE